MLVQWVELHGIYQSRVMFGDSDYGENCLRILELHGIYQSRVTLGDSDYRENCLRILDVLLISCVTVLVHVSCYDRKLQIGSLINNRTLFPTALDTGKPKIKETTDLVSGEIPPPSS